MPCAAPPWSWPSTIVGLMARPGSCTIGVREQADLARLHVDLDRRGLGAEGPRDGVGIEVGARVKPGLAGRLERLRLHGGVRDLAQAHGPMRHADDVHPALLDADVFGRALEHLGGDTRRLARGPRARSARPQARSWRPRGSRRCPCRTGRAPCRRRRLARPPRRRRARRRRSAPASSRGPGPAPSRRCRRRPCRSDPRGPSRPRTGRARSLRVAREADADAARRHRPAPSGGGATRRSAGASSARSKAAGKSPGS